MNNKLESSDVMIIGVSMFILSALIFALGSLIGFGDGQKSMQKEAVKAGHAVWVADDEGKAQFKWK